MPAGHISRQSSSLTEPDGDVPFAQVTHVVDESAPDAGENVPSTHLSQVLAESAPTLGEYVPELHKLQSTDAVWPLDSRYVPAAHAAHVLPSPVNPALHKQSCTELLASSDQAFIEHGRHVDWSPDVYEPLAHSVHTVAVAAACSLECLPLEHWVHAAEPIAALKDPAGHSRQLVALPV